MGVQLPCCCVPIRHRPQSTHLPAARCGTPPRPPSCRQVLRKPLEWLHCNRLRSETGWGTYAGTGWGTYALEAEKCTLNGLAVCRVAGVTIHTSWMDKKSRASMALTPARGISHSSPITSRKVHLLQEACRDCSTQKDTTWNPWVADPMVTRIY